jgi:AraC-like DNA-binding protein
LEKNDNSYVEVPPPAALADCVLELWEMRIPSAPGVTSVRILPNACVDIVLYASEPSRGTGDAQIVAPPHRSYVVGSTLRSFMVQSVGWRHIVGASLRPEGTQPLLGMPAGVIGESVAFLNDIIGPDAGAMEDFVLSGPASGVLRRFAEWLLGRRRAAAPPDLTAHRAVALIHGASGRGRIDSVLDHLNVSARQLERKFLTHVGMPPKLFSRLVRFDRAVRGIPARGAMPWSQFALAYGYADQSHFINEFREFAGVTPAEYEAGAH